MKKVVFLFCISLFLIACNKLVFEETMPPNGKRVTSFPEEIQGTYVQLDFNEKRIYGVLFRIEQKNTELIVYKQEVEYADSTYLAYHNLSEVDTAWFADNRIHFRSGKELKTIPYLDALCFDTEEVYYRLNFSNSTYTKSNNEEGHFEVRSANNAFYLNTDWEDHYKQVIQVKKKNEGLQFYFPSIILADSSTLFDDLVNTYHLKYLNNEGKGKDLLASLNDEEFKQLMDEEGIFFEFTWYKIDSPSTESTLTPTSWLTIIGGIITGFILVLLVGKYVVRSKKV